MGGVGPETLRRKRMSLQSESSGKAKGFAVFAGLVKRSSSSVFGTSLWGRGPHSFSAVRSLEQARWPAVAAVCQGIPLGSERPLASVKAARGAVALSASSELPSVSRLHPLRYGRLSESGGLACIAQSGVLCRSTSRVVALLGRVLPNNVLVPTAQTLSRLGTRACGAAAAQHKRSATKEES